MKTSIVGGWGCQNECLFILFLFICLQNCFYSHAYVCSLNMSITENRNWPFTHILFNLQELHLKGKLILRTFYGLTYVVNLFVVNGQRICLQSSTPWTVPEDLSAILNPMDCARGFVCNPQPHGLCQRICLQCSTKCKRIFHSNCKQK